MNGLTRIEQCSWSRVHKLDGAFLSGNRNEMTLSLLRRYHIEPSSAKFLAISHSGVEKSPPCEYTPMNGTQYVPESMAFINDPSR